VHTNAKRIKDLLGPLGQADRGGPKCTGFFTDWSKVQDAV
jgi:hypothetical protein